MLSILKRNKRNLVTGLLVAALLFGGVLLTPQEAQAEPWCYTRCDPSHLWWTVGYCGVGVLYGKRCWTSCCEGQSCWTDYFVGYECVVG